MVSYEDVQNKVAYKILSTTSVCTPPHAANDYEELETFLKNNPSLFGKLVCQLIQHYKTWTSYGIHTPYMTVSYLIVYEGNLYVNKWDGMALCREECVDCPDPLFEVIQDMAAIAYNAPIDDRLPIPNTHSHPAFRSHVPDSGKSVSKWAKDMAGFMGILYLPALRFVASHSADEVSTCAALMLAHKMYREDEDKYINPAILTVFTEKRVSVPAIAEAEQKLVDSLKYGV